MLYTCIIFHTSPDLSISKLRCYWIYSGKSFCYIILVYMIYLGIIENQSHMIILWKIFLFIKYFISYTCNYYLSKESSTTFEHIIIIITINHRIMCIKIQCYLLSRNSAAFVFVVITFPKSIWMCSSELHALLLF